MKVLRRTVALIGIVVGVFIVWCTATMWRFVQEGPGNIVWDGYLTWKWHAFYASVAMLGIAVIVASYWFGFRRRAEQAGSPNGGPAKPQGNSGATGGPPSVT